MFAIFNNKHVSPYTIINSQDETSWQHLLEIVGSNVGQGWFQSYHHPRHALQGEPGLL
jgi:hypothetical protein